MLANIGAVQLTILITECVPGYRYCDLCLTQSIDPFMNRSYAESGIRLFYLIIQTENSAKFNFSVLFPFYTLQSSFEIG